jgi:sphinganine-1-phosphate aldolase
MSIVSCFVAWQHVSRYGARFFPDLLLRLTSTHAGLLPVVLMLEARRGRGFTRAEDVWKAGTLLAQLLLFRRLLRGAFDAMRTEPVAALKNVAGAALRFFKTLPYVREKVAAELSTTVSLIEDKILGDAPDCGANMRTLRKVGRSKDEVMAMLRQARSVQDDFDSGKAAGGIYHVEAEELTVLQNEAAAIYSCSNALYPGVFPGLRKFEAEIVSMVLHMLNGDPARGHCGVLTSGGTESVLMAVLAHREFYREHRGVTAPEIVACTTAHAALDKACHYFGITLIHIEPEVGTMQLPLDAVARALTANTIMVYTSAPGYPHGVVDNISAIAQIAERAGVGCHVDNCLGGFLMSALKEQGLLDSECSDFDLTVPGVTSISVDVHKYGFATKGVSVVLYRNAKLRRGQYTLVTDWTGGLYATPGAGGSRGGHSIAAAWATCVYMGWDAYLRTAKSIYDTWRLMRDSISATPGLRIVGHPAASVVAFTSDVFDIYMVADEMKANGGWEVDRMQRPPCLHICVTAKTGLVAAQWLADLRAATLKCKDSPAQVADGMAGIYGQASIVPDRSIVSDILASYLDVVYTAGSD